MLSQHTHLQQTLQDLGYTCSSSENFPSIPNSCIPLVSVLVDDLVHAQAKVTQLETQVHEANEKIKDLGVQLGSMAAMARKVGDDNARLRERLRELEWMDEKVVELEYLLREYKGPNNQGDKADLDRLGERVGNEELKMTREEDTAVRVKKLEKVLEARETELHHLETILLHQLSPSLSSPTPQSRIIYLEEHIRTLESVPPLLFLTDLDALHKVTGSEER